MALEEGGYDKNGKYVGREKGAYTAPSAVFPNGRKVGYDEDDMKVGQSDTARFLDDPRHMANEDAYMKMHPIVRPKSSQGWRMPHPSPNHEHLSNDHGGHRTESDVRYDIRHGYNIARQRGQSQSLLSAEDMGYAARKHIYIQREEDARKKKEAPVAARSQQFMQSMQAKDSAPGGVFHEYSKPTPPAGNPTEWDSEPSAPARTPAPKAKSSKPKPYRDPNDTFGAAVKHVVNKFRGK